MKAQLKNQNTTLQTGNLQIDALTDTLLRIHIISDDQGTDRQVCTSYAIENRPKQTGSFTQQTSQTFCTEKLQLEFSSPSHMTISTPDGQVICEDYTDAVATKENLSQEELDLMAQEGHVIPDGDAPCSYQVYKKLFGDEHFYGLGDKTGFLDKKGYDYIMWNSDLPDPHVENPSYRALYKSIPFFLVLRPDSIYGIFVDNPHKTFFDLGYESTDYYSFAATKGDLDYYFIYGDTMAEVLADYTSLTGRAPLPQLWTLGYHQSRWSYSSADEVRSLANTFRELQIPCDAIHLDIDYMDSFKVFTTDATRFPDLTALSDELAEKGIKLVTIIDPGVKAEPGYFMYDAGIREGYFAQTPEGDVYQNVVWPGDSVFPDFTSGKVRDWWASQTQFQTRHHIRGIWNDMNEPASFQGPLPDDVVFPGDDDTDVLLHEDIHNVYGHLMAKATYEGLKQTDGRRPFVITRACYSGTQKYSTAWTGDNQSLWCHLKMSIPQLLNLGLSGMPLVGTDIGGFGANTTPELLCRWIEASCFAPLFRNHSGKYTRKQEPWQFDQTTLDINRKYIKLHYHFLPYLYDLCYQETQTGLPILRPLVLHYTDDPNTVQCNDEYLVGDKLLVAPITDQGATVRSVYLPEGNWINYWDDTRIEGGQYILQQAPLDYCPIYVKAGSILPTYPEMTSIDPASIDTLQLQIYPDSNGQTEPYMHYQDNGEDFAYQQGEYNLYHFADLTEKQEISAEKYLEYAGYSRVYSSLSLTVH
ncbi:MAG: glycoside hydrolase family 31 protein [Eubacteriales bacterium]|nr:glycoside hydrolase family 31 protein [Eubacteriales bacterium]